MPHTRAGAAQATWLRQRRLFDVPIVTHEFRDSLEYAGNIYGKAGLVLEMLSEQLGDDAFFHALQHYLRNESAAERGHRGPDQSDRGIGARQLWTDFSINGSMARARHASP